MLLKRYAGFIIGKRLLFRCFMGDASRAKIYRFLGPLALVFVLFYYMQIPDKVGKMLSSSESKVVNVYSARKEELVGELFEIFRQRTGIKVNFITDEAGKLLARLDSEGRRSPMDVFWTADFLSLSLASDKLRDMPASIIEMTSKGFSGNKWVAVARRARVIVYSKDRVKADELKSLRNYEDLALPVWHGRLVTRSSASTYNQFLIASMILHDKGDAAGWCHGVAENFARNPQGGDTDQLRAIASGVADVAVVNHYYYERMLHSSEAADKAMAEKMIIVYPNQDNRGTHINISGVGIAKDAPHAEHAEAFVRFLLSEEAQRFFVNKNHEYPVRGKPLSEFMAEYSGYKFDGVDLEDIARYYSEAESLSVNEGWY